MVDDIETGPEGAGDESLRDTIMSAVEAQTKVAEPREEQAELPLESQEPQDRPRDDKGRFAAKQEAIEDEPVIEPQEALSAPEPAPSQKPPPGLSVKTIAEWDKLPEHVRADIVRREAEIDSGLKRYTGLAKFAEIAEKNGRPLSDAVADYWQVEQSLRSNFLGGIEAICQRFGVDQRALAEAMAQRYGIQPNGNGEAPQPVPQQQFSPQALIDNALTRFRQEQQEREVQQTIEAFKNDPANRYFENVRGTMKALLADGQAQTLKEAYDAALWLNPDTRALLLAEQKAKPATKTAAVTQARAAAKAVTGAPGPNSKPDSGAKPEDMSVKDTIRAAIQAQMDA